jgi:hypothetical protein
MNTDSYVKTHYGVPDDVGRMVHFKDRTGVIYETGGNYVNVNFDDQKPGVISYIHPTDSGLTYGFMGTIRKRTRSQQRYRMFIESDCCMTFKEWLQSGNAVIS